MNCNNETLLLFWSGELPEEERIAMATHLNECPACRERYLELLDLSVDIEMVQEEPAPRDFVGEALQRAGTSEVILLDEKRARSSWLPSLGGFAVAAAAAIILAVMIPWSHYTTPDAPVRIELTSAVTPGNYAVATQYMKNRTPSFAKRLRPARRGSAWARASVLQKKVRMAKRTYNAI